jgi:hypothetical protein
MRPGNHSAGNPAQALLQPFTAFFESRNLFPELSDVLSTADARSVYLSRSR